MFRVLIYATDGSSRIVTMSEPLDYVEASYTAKWYRERRVPHRVVPATRSLERLATFGTKQTIVDLEIDGNKPVRCTRRVTRRRAS